MSSGKLFTFFKFNNEICKINTLRAPPSLSCSGIGIPDYTFDKFIHVESPLSQNIKESVFEEPKVKSSVADKATTVGASAIEASAIEATAIEASAIEATAIEATAIEATAIEATSIKKYKKKKITPTIKKHIWNTYIGYDLLKHKCFCCKKATIQINEFEAGHVLSEADGGSCEISNFRPICRNCNLSMGSMHMEDYIKKYGLYI
jgi:hypothetical protein